MVSVQDNGLWRQVELGSVMKSKEREGKAGKSTHSAPRLAGSSE